jgi:hypothetical protein
MRNLIWVLICSCILFACGPSTKIENSWHDPNVTKDQSQISKFVVMALLKNEATRRITEDNLARMYSGKAVQSYTILGMGQLVENEQYYTDKFKELGFDGAIVMRLVKVEKEVGYVPGTYPGYYGSWYGYYNYAWGGFYSPAYITTDQTYYVETNVYSFSQNKLIYTCTTSTVDPNNSTTMLDEVIKTVNNDLKAKSIIK